MASDSQTLPRLRTHEKDNSTLVFIPGGEFTMGSDAYSVERTDPLPRYRSALHVARGAEGLAFDFTCSLPRRI